MKVSTTVLKQRRMAVCVLAAGLFSACGGGPAPPPQPGESRGFPPDLRGRAVMVLPVQQNFGIPGDPSAEFTFALTDRTDEVEWIVEEDVQEVLRRSPGIDADTRGLPVAVFRQAAVERIGDPLYGQIRRMAALVGADVVILPVAVSFEANSEIPGATPRVRFMAAILDARTGRVLWFGIEEGEDYPREDPRALASAADRLSRSILWYAGR